MPGPLTCAIIDDEPLAVKLLESYAQKTPFLNLVNTYGSAVEAVYALQASPVDILFLDIQMPDLTGLDFARMIPSSIHVIFTTAFREFAIDGYKVGAVDYLLKPISYSDFLSAAQRVLARVNKQETTADNVQSTSSLDAGAVASGTQQTADFVSDNDSFFIKSEYKYVRVSYQDILYIEGLKDYVKIHLLSSGRSVISLVSMRTLESALPSFFLRIHRSYIVNMLKVNVVDRNSIALSDYVLPISDSYKDAVQRYVAEHAIQGR